MTTLLRKKQPKVRSDRLIILILFTYHKLTYGQTQTKLKIQNFSLTVDAPGGGICTNVPMAYGYNGWTGLGTDQKISILLM